MIADLDGANLRAFMDAHGGRTTFRATGENNPLEIQTGRSGVVTSFSSGGPTNFDHKLKPDLAAPGGQILSSTLREFAGSDFAVIDGTSMSAPHVSGAAALLLQQHPSWTAQQVKSALMTTAGPAWGNTARTQEASVLLEGGGLINVAAANDPRLFADPASLSYGFLDATGTARKALLVSLTDAGDGSGPWTVSIDAQSATSGAAVTPGASVVTIAPGGTVDLPVVVSAASGAPRGDDYGFVVLQRGADRIRIPYYFTVSQPQIAHAPISGIKRRSPLAPGNTRTAFYPPLSPPNEVISTMSSCPAQRARASLGRSRCCGKSAWKRHRASTTTCRYEKRRYSAPLRSGNRFAR